jgi:membrane protein DedA with SNARE-associated domain
MFHSLLIIWFDLTLKWGYPGVFVLMAIESTVFPLPSEVVIPPAAYLATQGHLNFWGVVAAATLGSWAGSALSYWVARVAGRPLLLRYGRYVFVPEKKWLLAEGWINRYSARMNFKIFTTMTLLGSFVWSTVLAWFGAKVLGEEKQLLQDPGAMVRVLKDKLIWFVAAAVILMLLYILVDVIGRRLRRDGAGATKVS